MSEEHGDDSSKATVLWRVKATDGSPARSLPSEATDGSEVARPRNAVLVSEANESTGALVSPGVSRNVFRWTSDQRKRGG